MSNSKGFSLNFDRLGQLNTIETFQADERWAAVLVAITSDASDPEVIFTRRSDKLRTHSGQVSFPGGKYEQQDDNLLQTGLREAYEEIALDPTVVELKGCLSPRISINGVYVRPIVGIVPDNVSLLANPEEIASIFKVPLSFFRETKPVRVDGLRRGHAKLDTPAWYYSDHGQNYDIWGLTAMVTAELLALINIPLDLTDVPFKAYGS